MYKFFVAKKLDLLHKMRDFNFSQTNFNDKNAFWALWLAP